MLKKHRYILYQYNIAEPEPQGAAPFRWNLNSNLMSLWLRRLDSFCLKHTVQISKHDFKFFPLI
jgi:hypothetical protein